MLFLFKPSFFNVSLYEINIGSQLLTKVLSQSKRIAFGGDLTIDLIQDIDSESLEYIDGKIKKWQSRSSYNGNYFEWKSKK